MIEGSLYCMNVFHNIGLFLMNMFTGETTVNQRYWERTYYL